MLYIVMAAGVWAVWSTLLEIVDASPWFWRVLPLALGVGAQCLLDWDRWWLGLGLGGLALLFMRLADLLLVTADWVRLTILRRNTR
jgi:hypothetical protein